MQRVVTINLNGNAYQLDDAAFTALRAYLDEAEVRLKDNPDRAEILADLEQAIAEKCRRFLGPHKTIRAARHGSRYAWGRHYGWFAMWDGLFMTGITVLGLWLLFRHMPPVHDFSEFMHNLPDAIEGAGKELMMWVRSVFEKPQ